VDVEEIVLVCSWYKCCIKLCCNSSWVNDVFGSFGGLGFNGIWVRLFKTFLLFFFKL
jgi:hypothetical protein